MRVPGEEGGDKVDRGVGDSSSFPEPSHRSKFRKARRIWLARVVCLSDGRNDALRMVGSTCGSSHPINLGGFKTTERAGLSRSLELSILVFLVVVLSHRSRLAHTASTAKRHYHGDAHRDTVPRLLCFTRSLNRHLHENKYFFSVHAGILNVFDTVTVTNLNELRSFPPSSAP